MNLKEYLNDYFKNNNIKEDNNDYIYRIICYYFNIKRSEAILKLNDRINEEEFNKLKIILDKIYIENVPIEYIINLKRIYNEDYFVNENVLIPREDTEILINTSIEYIQKYKLKKMLDMCTGSGCVGISICNNSCIKNAVLCDISANALDVANINIKKNNCQKAITCKSNLFNDIAKNEKFDIIVSNPPYIKTDVIKNLDKSVLKEPIIALDGGIDGLFFYNKILNDSQKYLNDNGFLIFEIGYDQKEELICLISKYKSFEYIESVKDLANNDRVIVCRFHQM